MSSDVKIPDERSLLEIAESLITAPYEWQSDAILAVADALLAAEQRGLERGRAQCIKIARTHGSWGTTRENNHTALPQRVSGEIAAAIRSLGEKT